MKESLKPVSDPELIIGLTGRLGTDTREVANAVANSLLRFGYGAEKIQVSDLIKSAYPDETVSPAPDQRISTLMKLGTEFREANRRADALASLSVAGIMQARKKRKGSVDNPISRGAFIINQLKRPEEIEFLKEVYGEQLLMISCHAPYDDRLKKLTEDFINYHAESPDFDKWSDKAKELITKDDKENEKPFGQRVQDAFPLADFFVNASKDIDKQVNRFFDLIFRDPRVSPTRDEYGTYLASSAALRSNDLSRQVGAAILTADGDILALGCNEVPIAGGGVYWPSEGARDSRDVEIGADINTVLKKHMILDVISRIERAGWLKKKYADLESEEILSKYIDKKTGILAKTKIMSSLEFGRAMHAEMAAITEAAKNGHALKGAILYCTTFPCHNCAKHIVGAGISKVVFREPYEKSRATQLYPDAIKVDSEGEGRTSFDQFIGVGPNRFRSLFAKSGLKDEKGRVKRLEPETAQPVCAPHSLAYMQLEAVVASSANKKD